MLAWTIYISFLAAVLQMFSHGILAGLLFGVVGRMVYDRAHTRELPVLQAMQLSKALPFAAGIFLIASVASMGLPGFSGFVAELSVLIGAWERLPFLTMMAGVGILLGVVYTLRVLQQAFFGGDERLGGPEEGKVLDAEPITWAERAGALLLVGSTLAVGLYPRLLLDVILPALQLPLFDRLWAAAAG